MMTLFGLTMLFPALASRLMAPMVSIGFGLSCCNSNYYDGSELPELESTFRHLPITEHPISSHPPPAELQHLG